MKLQMLTDSEDLHLSVPQRFFAYAYAYRNAASALTKEMALENGSYTWSNASVVLMLTAHATELFIKGAILSSDPDAKIDPRHNIDKLSAQYRTYYSDPSFEWSIPFETDDLGATETNSQPVKDIEEASVPSIRYRYPVTKQGKEWNCSSGFEPFPFLSRLSQIKCDFDRIINGLEFGAHTVD